VFLSYSRKDAALVQRVADGLMAAGFLADFDQAAHDPGNVSAGISAEDEWWKRLQEMIASADVMVFLVSPDSAQSAVCDEEIAYARALGKRIIAVLARSVDFARAPPRLSALNVRIDFSESGPGFDAALAALVSALQMNVGWHRDGRKYYARVQEWDSAGRPKSRLLREGAVEEAERWALARPRNEPEPGELFLAWVAASRAQIKRDAAVRAFWRRVTAVFVLTTLIATVAGAWFVVNGKRNLGRSESLMLARTADQFYNDGDYLRALHLAILASRDSFLAPSTDEAKAAFAKSAQSLRLVRTIALDDTGASFDAGITRIVPAVGGRRLLVSATDNRVELYDAETGARLAGPIYSAESGSEATVSVSANGTRAVAKWSRAAYLIDTETGQVTGPITPGEALAGLSLSVLSPDGTRLVLTESFSDVAALRDAVSGEVLADLGGEGATWDVQYSDDGQVLMTTTQRALTIRDGASGAPLHSPFEFPEAVSLRAFLSPDGRHIIAGYGSDRLVHIDVATGGMRNLAGRVGSGARQVVFAGRSNRFVTVSAGGAVQLWALDTLTPVGEAQRADSANANVQVSETLLLVKSYVGGVRVLSLETGAQVSEDGVAFEEEFTGAMLMPHRSGYLVWDGRQVIYQPVTPSMIDPEYEDFDLLDDQPRQVLIAEHPGFIEDIVLSPEGGSILTYNSDQVVHQWDLATGIRTMGPMVNSSFWMTDGYLDGGAHIFTVEGDRIMVWQARENDVLAAVQLPAPGPVVSTLLSPDGQFTLAANEAGIGVVWDNAANRAAVPEVLLGDQEWVAAFDEQGTALAISFENVMQVYDLAAGMLRATLIEMDADISGAAFSPDGRRLVTADSEGGVQVWDAASLTAVGEPLAHQAYAPLVLSPSSDRLAIWSGTTAQLVDLETGRTTGPALAHQAGGEGEMARDVLGATFSADGRTLLTWSSAELRSWNAATGVERMPRLKAPEDIYGVVPVDDASKLVVLYPNSVRIYDGMTGDEQASLEGIGAVGGAISPGGGLIATWGNDSMVRFWDTERRTSVGNPVNVGLFEQTGAFTPDGRRLLLSEPSGTYRIFDTRTGDLIAALSDPSGGVEARWTDGGQALLSLNFDGQLMRWDTGPSLRPDVTAEDIGWACTARLSGSPDAAGVPVVRRLDARSTFLAPILRRREGEDVCMPPPAAWWETAAGAVFGWAFQ
jgi:WD40 repeat protein